MKIYTLALCLPLLLLVACAGNTTEEIPAHLRNIENLTVFESTEEAPTIELVRTNSIGESDDVLIGDVGSLTVDDRGRIFIVDRRQPVVFAFDSDGTFITTVGREGSGPGEFSRPFNIEIKGNRLYVHDPIVRRINAFSLESLASVGTIIQELPDVSHMDELDGLNLRATFLRSDESFLVRYGRGFSPSNPDVERPLHYYIMRDGEIQSDRLFSQERESIFLTDPDNSSNFSLFAFTPAALLALGDDDRVYLSPSDEFLIHVHDSDGTHLRSIYYPFEKKSINPDEIVDDYENEMHKRMIRSYDLYDTWPVIRSIMVDDEHRLWISTFGESDDEQNWWVLENSGELIGRFNWPGNRPIQEVTGGHVYTRETNEEGFSNVGKYAINIRPASGN